MKIRHRKERTKPWELDCGRMVVDGVKKRVHLYFATKGDAIAEMEQRKKTTRKFGSVAFELGDEMQARFVNAQKKLERVNASIEEAVEYFLRHSKTVSESVTLSDCVERALLAKEDAGGRESYLGALRVVWRGFARGREQVNLGDVTRRDVESWLDSGSWGRRTKASKLGDLRGLFSWAIKQQLLVEDPAKGIEVKVLADEAEVSCMTPAQARRLMEVVSEQAADFLAYVALGIFAGLRTVEIEKLGADDLQLDDGIVVVSSAMVKTRARRVVKLSDNAVAWLRVWKQKARGQEAVLPFSWERRWGALREFAGWKLPWPKNVMRHTAASMHYALHADEAALKSMLGHHAGEETLHRHYRAVKMLDGRIITAKVAAEFWGIVPRMREAGAGRE